MKKTLDLQQVFQLPSIILKCHLQLQNQAMQFVASELYVGYNQVFFYCYYVRHLIFSANYIDIVIACPALIQVMESENRI